MRSNNYERYRIGFSNNAPQAFTSSSFNTLFSINFLLFQHSSPSFSLLPCLTISQRSSYSLFLIPRVCHRICCKPTRCTWPRRTSQVDRARLCTTTLISNNHQGSLVEGLIKARQRAWYRGSAPLWGIEDSPRSREWSTFVSGSSTRPVKIVTWRSLHAHPRNDLFGL